MGSYDRLLPMRMCVQCFKYSATSLSIAERILPVIMAVDQWLCLIDNAHASEESLQPHLPHTKTLWKLFRAQNNNVFFSGFASKAPLHFLSLFSLFLHKLFDTMNYIFSFPLSYGMMVSKKERSTHDSSRVPQITYHAMLEQFHCWLF